MTNFSDLNASDMFAEDRLKMVEKIRTFGVTNNRVLDIMNIIPRHLFIADGEKTSECYSDYPINIGFCQTISQPYIVAYMTEQLEIKSTDKILEIGTGSGYQTAILAQLALKVYTIEIIPELLATAIRIIDLLGIDNVKFLNENGYNGWQREQPFDKIILTCAPEIIPENLISQLSKNGKMILPLGKFNQSLCIISIDEDVTTRKEDLPVRFVPMVKEL